jgi:acetylornithine deacetylase
MMKSRTQDVCAEALRGRADEVISLLTELVAAPSIAGQSGEAAQHVLGKYLASIGYKVEYTVDDPARHASHPQYTPPPAGEFPVNLIAIPPGQRASHLGLFAHIDTEPAHEGWRSPPMRATARDGRLYGLGAADDKSGVAAAAVAAAVMLDARQRAPVIMSVHGKGGGARGTLPVFTRMPKLAGALYVHPAETGLGLSQIKHVSRGVLDLTLMVTGWHGPLREIGTPESASFAKGGDAFRAALVVIDHLRAGPFAGCDENVGHIAAGARPGVVPLTCQIDIRVLFDGARTAADLIVAADAAIEQCERELASPAGRFSVGPARVVFRANPAVTAWDAPLSRVTRDAVVRVTGRPPTSYTAHVASDLRFPLLVAGCPAVGLGPLAGGFYGADEWVDIDDLRRVVQVLVTAVQAWNDMEEQ